MNCRISRERFTKNIWSRLRFEHCIWMHIYIYIHWIILMWGDVKNWERIEHSRAICPMSWASCEVAMWSFSRKPSLDMTTKAGQCSGHLPYSATKPRWKPRPQQRSSCFSENKKRETNKSKAYHLGFKSITDLIQELAGHVFYDFMSMELTWTYSGCLLWACTDSNRMCSQSLLFVIPSQHGFSFDSGRGQQIGLTAGVSLENIREMYSDATKMPQRRNDAFMEAGISLELAQFVCDSGS